MNGKIARTIPELGRLLAADSISITAAALRRMDLIEGVTALERGGAVEMLVDRYLISMTQGKPIGLALWSARYARRFGAIGVVDTVVAVSYAISSAGMHHSIVDARELWQFLKRLEVDLVRHSIAHASPLHVRGVYDPPISIPASL